MNETMTAAEKVEPGVERRGSPIEVLLVFLKLGVSCFGGPIAHIGYFRNEFVQRRRWLDEPAYADLVALCQFLPGPASSQVGFSLGLMRAGILGGLAAWTGFTLPSAILLVLFAYGANALAGAVGAGLLHGLKLVAVAIVAQAVWGMARTLAPDRERASIATAFFLLLGGLPILQGLWGAQGLAVFDAFYRSGALVFGGGHVVLPLLRDAVVAPGWISDNTFLAGYGAAQAVPGPLFTFAAYLGTVIGIEPHGVPGAALALFAIFLPGVLIIIATLPFWDMFRLRPDAQAVMRGVNAAVVGLLGAALYSPVWTSSVETPGDFGLALLGFVLLTVWRTPPLVVVIVSAAGGILLATLPH
jgi:chromate transporter